MKFAVNHSQPAIALWEQDPSQFDLFKMPEWPHLVEPFCTDHPCYVHFSLEVTDGSGTILDSETNAPVDFDRVERLLNLTQTPLVNVHLAPKPHQHPDIAPENLSPAATEKLTARMLRDVEVLTRQFGKEHVIAENDAGGRYVLAAALPAQVICTVIEEAGCGFLFDLSHARLVARQLKLDAKEYIAQLPLQRLQEMHLTGIQYLGENWQTILRASGELNEEHLARFRDRWMDHLPFTDEDWDFTAWALDQIHSGAWRKPWVASCEYGGTSYFFRATLDEAVVRTQFPKLNTLVKNNTTAQ
jgi:uncharacterized protein (UPF0276 family)